MARKKQSEVASVAETEESGTAALEKKKRQRSPRKTSLTAAGKKSSPRSHRKYSSQAIIVGCGDYRLLPFVRKYLKRLKHITRTDVASTAGGSRTLSLYGLRRGEKRIFRIKRKALLIDLDKYKHHGAKTVVIACHSHCGFWPEFESEAEEFEAHCISLIQAGVVIKQELPEIEEVILLYIQLEDEEPYMPVKVYEVQFDGTCVEAEADTVPILSIAAEIDTRTNPMLAMV